MSEIANSGGVGDSAAERRSVYDPGVARRAAHNAFSDLFDDQHMGVEWDIRVVPDVPAGVTVRKAGETALLLGRGLWPVQPGARPIEITREQRDREREIAMLPVRRIPPHLYGLSSPDLLGLERRLPPRDEYIPEHPPRQRDYDPEVFGPTVDAPPEERIRAEDPAQVQTQPEQQGDQ